MRRINHEEYFQYYLRRHVDGNFFYNLRFDSLSRGDRLDRRKLQLLQHSARLLVQSRHFVVQKFGCVDFRKNPKRLQKFCWEIETDCLCRWRKVCRRENHSDDKCMGSFFLLRPRKTKSLLWRSGRTPCQSSWRQMEVGTGKLQNIIHIFSWSKKKGGTNSSSLWTMPLT